MKTIRLPEPNWGKKCKYKTIGFVHISKTGGTYLSRKMLLGVYDPHLWRHGYIDHKPIPVMSLSERSHWFTIVRNPYDRIASELNRKKLTLKNLLEDGLPKYGHFSLQSSLAVFANTILRYESMPLDVNHFLQNMRLPSLDFGDFKARSHSLNKKEKGIIFDLYRSDFEMFGYKP